MFYKLKNNQYLPMGKVEMLEIIELKKSNIEEEYDNLFEFHKRNYHHSIMIIDAKKNNPFYSISQRDIDLREYIKEIEKFTYMIGDNLLNELINNKIKNKSPDIYNLKELFRKNNVDNLYYLKLKSISGSIYETEYIEKYQDLNKFLVNDLIEG